MNHLSSKKFKIGIIGYGKMGASHARAWAGIPEAEISAIADRDEEQIAAAKAAYSCPVFKDAREMLKEVQLDIVVVATQAQYRLAPVLAAIEHGCHVICEKPMAINLEDADKMIEAAERKGVTLAVHHEHILIPAVAKAEEMIRRGAIGDLYFMEGFAKGRPAPYELMEEAIHMLHMMRYFSKSEVAWCFGHIQEKGRDATEKDLRPLADFYPVGRSTGGAGAGDYIFGYYRFANGVCGALRLKNLERTSNEYAAVELQGTKGRIKIHFSNNYSSSGRLFYKSTPQDDFSTIKWQEIDVGYRRDFIKRFFYRIFGGPPKPFITTSARRFARHFLDALREGRKPKVTGADGRAALEMALGIYESHFQKKPIDLSNSA